MVLILRGGATVLHSYRYVSRLNWVTEQKHKHMKNLTVCKTLHSVELVWLVNGYTISFSTKITKVSYRVRLVDYLGNDSLSKF